MYAEAFRCAERRRRRPRHPSASPELGAIPASEAESWSGPSRPLRQEGGRALGQGDRRCQGDGAVRASCRTSPLDRSSPGAGSNPLPHEEWGEGIVKRLSSRRSSRTGRRRRCSSAASWPQPREPCEEFQDFMCRVSLRPMRSWWPTMAEPSPFFVQLPQVVSPPAVENMPCGSEPVRMSCIVRRVAAALDRLALLVKRGLLVECWPSECRSSTSWPPPRPWRSATGPCRCDRAR